MNLFKKLKLSVLMHQHKYDKVLATTAFAITKNAKNIDPDILRYQGVSSFYKNNLYHSKMCFELLTESPNVKSNDFVYLAFMHARQNEKEKAISAWCKSLENNKNNKYASKALNYIRNKGKEINLMEDSIIEEFIPKEPTLIPYKKIFVSCSIILLCLICAAIFSIYGVNTYSNYKQNIATNRPELDAVYLDDFNPNIIQSPKDNNQQYSYNEKEIQVKFNKIKSLIAENKAVAAQIEINEIKLSNASPSVKMKMDILKDFISEPDYGFFKNELTYSEFIKNKLLYEDVYIMWSGRMINKSVYKNKITFDLVIGDEDVGTIDAIIPVVFNKATTIKNNEKVHVFGKISINHDENKAFIDGHNAVRQ